jgi:ribosome biogenesis GTPase
VTGQSGVGKSSLLNAVQPGLALRVGEVMEQSRKGRHTTTNAHLIRLEIGGYVVDTPGIRSFDVSIVPQGELEAYFDEFVDRVRDCKFPDCTHTHEIGCAIKTAVEHGDIHIDRYLTYIELFEEAAARRAQY